MAKIELIKFGRKWVEENAEAEDEAADDGRQPGRPLPAEQSDEGRKGQTHAQRKCWQTTWKKVLTNDKQLWRKSHILTMILIQAKKVFFNSGIVFESYSKVSK